MSETHFATRLNSLGSRPETAWPGLVGKPSATQLAERAATVRGLTHVDLNFPDHVAADPEIAKPIRDLGLEINGFAMRYYTNPAFKLGALTNPDPAVRREAIDLTKRGIDAAMRAGAPLMTLWLGQDGFDYAFQADYARLWDLEISGIREIADHDRSCSISLEYKPNEPRAYSLLPDCATTLIAIRAAGAPNLGVTIDFAHSLYADEEPAFAAMLAAKESRLFGVHLNDGNGKRDDGLMVASVHTLKTLELLLEIRRSNYAAPLYFDTFPDLTGLDPVRECEVNIATVRRLLKVAAILERDEGLAAALDKQDAVEALDLVNRLLFAETDGG
jgi:xylose isomerase